MRCINCLNLLSFSLALTLAMSTSACSPCSTNFFQVRHSATPMWASRKVCRLWRHVSTSVDWVMPLGQQSAMLQNLSMKVLIDSPFFYLAARRVGTKISISSSKKWARNIFSRSAHILIEPVGSFMNHSKATPLRMLMNKQAIMASFDTTFPVWDLK